MKGRNGGIKTYNKNSVEDSMGFSRGLRAAQDLKNYCKRGRHTSNLSRVGAAPEGLDENEKTLFKSVSSQNRISKLHLDLA